MHNIILLIAILALTEIFEALLQRDSTMFGILNKLYAYYQKSIFLFFLVQPSLYIIFFIILITGIMNISMILLLSLKIFDLFFKLDLIKKIFIQNKIPEELKEMLHYELPLIFQFLGVMVSPPLLFWALV